MGMSLIKTIEKGWRGSHEKMERESRINVGGETETVNYYIIYCSRLLIKAPQRVTPNVTEKGESALQLRRVVGLICEVARSSD